MKISIHEKDNSKVAIIENPDIVIGDVQGALDLMASIHYEHDCQKILMKKMNITEEFFNLRTRLADFIYECIELPPIYSLTNCLKWGIPTNTKVSLGFMSRQS
ncbi:DUF4180 domain-containing protein, partial [Bacillus pseudomycoides]|uniref:DUF4180 domain-containing protein n=1 Tax=Bacillus pseudomycoides TaxID=64104 RepID=UPI001155D7ED